MYLCVYMICTNHQPGDLRSGAPGRYAKQQLSYNHIINIIDQQQRR